MLEIEVLNPGPVEDEYKAAIENISGYVKSDTLPPKEKEIVFDEDIGKFATNFNIAYSGYLTMLYGYKEPMEYDDKFRPIVGKWNRTLARAKSGKELTAKNKEMIEEINNSGFNFDECVGEAAVEETEVEE